jgi:signal transduction histidine kinase
VDKVLGPFERLDGYTGHPGLGLALVARTRGTPRRTCPLSLAHDEGTRVSFTLPVREEPFAGPMAAAADDDPDAAHA